MHKTLDQKTFTRIKFSRRDISRALTKDDFIQYYDALKDWKITKNKNALKFIQFFRVNLKRAPTIRYYFEIDSSIETYFTFVEERTRRDCVQFVFKRLKEKIRLFRVNSRLLRPDNSGRVGLVHLTFNSLTVRVSQDKINRCFESKRPSADEKYLGVEIECFVPMNHKKVANHFVKAKLENYIELKHDGSIETPDDDESGYCDDCDEYDCECFDRDEWNDLEVNILVKEKEYPIIIKKVCDVLKSIGADYNESCGLHVHLDCRKRKPNVVYYNLVRFMAYLRTQVDDHRLNNPFCVANDTDSFSDEGRNHYNAINGTAAYEKYKTIEVRLKESTLNDKEINNWIDVLLRIGNRQSKVRRLLSDDIKTMEKRLKIRKIRKAA